MIPLSLAQRRLWFLNRLAGSGSTGNVPLAVRMSGSVDREALLAALSDVVARHESLRTIFPERDGEPCQQVLAPADAPVVMPVVGVPPDGLGAAVAEVVTEPFHLDAGVPLRASLLALGATEHVLVVVAHHIIADSWSIRPLLRDLSIAYSARRRQESPQWSDFPLPYTDYALWRREVLGEQSDPASAAGRQLDHWRTVLAGVPGALGLPADRPRPVTASYRGGNVPLQLSVADHDALVGLARDTGTTLFMVLHAAVAALLSHLGAGTDLLIGTTVSGRTDGTMANVVGCFGNTLVLRTDTAGQPTFRELLARVRDVDLVALANADVPFERVAELMNPNGTLSAHPLPPVALTVRRDVSNEFDFPGLRIEVEEVPAGFAELDLAFDFVERMDAGSVTGSIQFAADLFDRGSVELMAERFMRILSKMVGDPDLGVDSIELSPQPERDRLQAEEAGSGGQRSVVTSELFAWQVALRGADEAVVAEGESLSYAELEARANRLARYLVSLGVGPERLVGVMLPRSTALVVALLAVHKAGGAYVPLDPGYPVDRLEFMVADSTPVCVVTTRELASRLPEVDEGPLLVLVDDPTVSRAVAGLPDASILDSERLAPLSVDSPAWVIYTSGSTGRPKGVVVTHRGIRNLVVGQSERFGIHHGSRLLQFASLSFDVAAAEIYGTLLCGGCLVLAEVSLTGLADVVAAWRVTHVMLPPVALGALPEGALPQGITLVVGADACPPELVGRWVPGRRMFNAYGPTETTVVATMSEPLSPGDAVVPIGRPIVGARVFVLDERLRPVPPGAVGELYVEGVGLARGYLGRAALTADRFVACPFGPPGTRLYRTGDLARCDQQGELVFAGRVDEQVKVRGFRVELGEIEATLRRHPAVAQVAVIVREDRPGDRRLVAYVVPSGEPAPADQLRQHVAGQLPEYMVPSAVVALDALPVNPNGKLDRAGLPAPANEVDVLAGPSDAREDILRGLFAEVLGLSHVNPDQDFFALGGDSIMSIELVAAARRAGLALTVRDVVELRTVAALASVATWAGSPQAEPDDDPGGEFGPIPIMGWLRELGDQFDGFNQSVAVRLPRGIRREDLETALRAVVDHHESLRQRLTVAPDGQWTFTIQPVGEPAVVDLLSRVDLAGATDEEVAATTAAAAEAARDRLAPRDGLMLQAVWFDLGQARAGRLLLVVHHLSIDVVSWRILVPDLALAWRHAAAGTKPLLDPVPTPARTWARGLAEESCRPDRVAEFDTWRRLLAGAEPPLGKRTLDPAVDVAGTLRSLSTTLPVEHTEPLLTTAPAAFHAGVNDVLLTGLALAVNKWRDRPDSAVLLDLESHGRQDVVPGADLSRTVGWFTSMYPVRLDPGPADWREVRAGGPAIGRALRAVRRQLRAVPGHGIGFGLLRYLNTETAPALAGLPAPQVGFNYVGRFGVSSGSKAGQQWDQVDDIAKPPALDAGQAVPHVLEINAAAVDGPDGPSLSVIWAWPEALLAEPDVAELAEAWFDALRALARHAMDPDAGGLTPSDLSLDLAQAEIDELEAELEAEQGALE